MLAHFLLPHKKNNHRAHLLRPVALWTMLSFLLGLQLTLSFLGKLNPQVLGMTFSITPQDIVSLTNDERGKGGLPALTMNPQLTQAAQRKGQDMLAKSYWAHVAPDGKQPWAFIREAGYGYERAGENLAKDFTDSTSTVQAWMNSPGHRANIMNVYYREIGVAVVSGVMNGRDTVIVVQMFGQPRGGSTAQLQNPDTAGAFSTPIPEPKGISVVNELTATGEIEVQRPTAAIPAQASSPIEDITDTQSNPAINPFKLTRTVALTIGAMLFVLLAVDVIYVARNRIVHHKHGHSTLHLVFIAIMILAIIMTNAGTVL